MTAKRYQRILAGFQHGWAKLGNKRFDVVIFTPSHSFQNPDGTNNHPWNREKDYYLAEVRLPYTDDTDNRDNFSLSGSVYVTHSPYEPLVSKTQPEYVKSCESFEKLCHHAGAALPEVIRGRLEGYCPWQCRSGASWWIALLAHVHGHRLRNPNGAFIDRHMIIRPWMDSVRLIELLKLNTDSPAWFEEPIAQDKVPNDGRFGPDGFYLDGRLVTGLNDGELALLEFALGKQPDGPSEDDVLELPQFKSWPRERLDKLLAAIKLKFRKAKCARVLRWANRHLVFREPREPSDSAPKTVKKRRRTAPRRKSGESLQKTGRHKRRR